MNSPIELNSSILNNIPKRKKDSHKGNYGHVLIIAGSRGMSGAAFLSALAAYRTGAGVVKIFTEESNRLILQTLLPEALIGSYDEKDMDFELDKLLDNLKEDLKWANVIVLGPGLGKGELAKTIVEEVLSEAYVPVIVDADALNIIAMNAYLEKFFTENIILTPHVKEMSRLVNMPVEKIIENNIDIAFSYCEKYGINLVLKSATSVIATKEGNIYLNVKPAPALAKAGSGDVLTGIMAGMLCLGMDDETALAAAVYLHGLAGRTAAKKLGEHGVLARDIISCIPYIMKDYEINIKAGQSNELKA